MEDLSSWVQLQSPEGYYMRHIPAAFGAVLHLQVDVRCQATTERLLHASCARRHAFRGVSTGTAAGISCSFQDKQQAAAGRLLIFHRLAVLQDKAQAAARWLLMFPAVALGINNSSVFCRIYAGFCGLVDILVMPGYRHCSPGNGDWHVVRAHCARIR
jgi:hypothetical protein